MRFILLSSTTSSELAGVDGDCLVVVASPCIWVISYLLLPSYFGFIDVNIDAKMKEKRTELRKRVQITVLQRTTRYVSNQCMVGRYSCGDCLTIKLRASHEIRADISKL